MYEHILNDQPRFLLLVRFPSKTAIYIIMECMASYARSCLAWDRIIRQQNEKHHLGDTNTTVDWMNLLIQTSTKLSPDSGSRTLRVVEEASSRRRKTSQPLVKYQTGILSSSSCPCPKLRCMEAHTQPRKEGRLAWCFVCLVILKLNKMYLQGISGSWLAYNPMIALSNVIVCRVRSKTDVCAPTSH